MRGGILIVATGLTICIACGTPAPPQPSPPVPIQRGIPREPVSDIDGNTYRTVQIGNQIWMAENLRTTRFRDGQPIPLVPDGQDWDRAGRNSAPAMCWHGNDPANAPVYGGLYNWQVASAANLAPAGWHVPTDTEWATLINQLGGQLSAGGRMKEAGTAHWPPPNTDSTNESGLTVLPAGYRHDNGIFDGFGRDVYMWAISQRGGWNVRLWFGGPNADSYSANDGYGLSVRCIRD